MGAGRERKKERAEHSIQGEKGVREKWRRSQTNRGSRMGRRDRRKGRRGQLTRKNEGK